MRRISVESNSSFRQFICCCSVILSGLCLCAATAIGQVIPCPVADTLCASPTMNCTTTVTGTQCFAKKLVLNPAPGGVSAVECACNAGECGAISYVAAVNSVRCMATCPVPPAGNECQVIVTIPPPMGSGIPTPSGTSFLNITPYPPGTTFECGCVPTQPPPCTPNSSGSACNPTPCPPDAQGLPQACLPVCIKVGPNGQQQIIDCVCMPTNQCHIEFGPVPGTPQCVGDCPPGWICNRTEFYNPADGSTTYCCHCEQPPICEPLPDNSACAPIQCPPDALGQPQECKPKCIFIDNQGLITVANCSCDNPDRCHAEMEPAGPICVGICPPGQVCIQRITPTANGTSYCCICVDDPPFCEPTSDGQGCKPFNCPPGATGVPEECKPRCVRTLNGVSVVIDCDCRRQNECHVEAVPGTLPYCTGDCPPGTYCVQNVIYNADGSVDTCCDCRPVICDCPGDIDGNGILNGLDIAGFIRCLLGNPLPVDNCACVDMDGNGIYNNIDVLIFIDYLLTKHQCNPTPCCPKENLSLNIGTGVADDGSLLPVNSLDTDWIVTVDASGGSVPTPATVTAPHPSWLTIPGTQWVTANYFGPNGTYEYEYCFCLDDRFKNPLLTLQIRADDSGTPPSRVYLNGNFLGNAASFGAAVPATLSTNNAGFFLKGRNCIKVVVENTGGAPTGFNMAGTVTSVDGKCCCPPADLSKDISSGVYDINGPLIPYGLDDDTWTVTCDATGGTTPRPAQTLVPHSAWAVIPGTRWVSATTGALNGWYCYQHCFCLDPRFKNATLNMQLLADDYAEVYLNGVLVGQTPNGWAFLNPPTNIFVTNQALFRDCENCIEIKVLNSGGVITGMDVKATITAQDGLCCDDRQRSCCMPDGTCIDLAPGVNQCPGGGQLMNGPCGLSDVSCCLPNGTCATMPQRCCLVQGGTILPAGTTCGAPVQACCIQVGASTICQMLDPACCTARGGLPQGAGSACLGDTNGDGSDDLCVPPPPVCPLGTDFGSQLCASHQQSECVGGTISTCRPKIVMTLGPGQGVVAELCTCFSGNGCGPVSVQPAATQGDYLMSCSGACGQGAGCALWVNGQPVGGGFVNSATLPAGSIVECRCFIP